MDPFEVSHTSSGSTCGQKIEWKRLEYLGTFPCECSYFSLSQIIISVYIV
jgi:hypothetical protein